MSTVDLARLRRDGEDRLARREWEPALPIFRRLVDAAGVKADVDLLRSLAICLDETDQRLEAARFFSAVLQKDPRDLIARRRLARLVGPPPVPPTRRLDRGRVRVGPSRGRVVPTHEEAKLHFRRVFPKGFRDSEYLKRERSYKWQAHELWVASLSRGRYERLLKAKDYVEICRLLRQINGSMNLLSRFESAAIGDATKRPEGRELLAEKIYDLVYGSDSSGAALDELVRGLLRLNLEGTSPAKWPIVTVFPFVADPARHFFVKPAVTKLAAERLRFALSYKPEPNAPTYRCALDLAARLRADLAEWRPRDNIDIQSFVWVTNSALYA